MSSIALLSLNTGQALAARVAAAMQVAVSPHEEREFEWGQHKVRPLENLRGRDVYVIESLHGDQTHSVNDKLCRLLFLLGAIRDADAQRVTVVAPYLCYSRKDRRTQPFDPVTTRYVAQLFEAMRIDRFATIEVHNPAAFDNAFRCPTEHIDAAPLLADVLARELAGRTLIVLSPDTGGVKRARHYAGVFGARLGQTVPTAFVEKYRSQDIVSGGTLVGEVTGRTVVVVDDMVAGGTTLARAAHACIAAGAQAVVAVAAHGAFSPEASRTLADAPVERMYVLDHIPPTALDPAFVQQRVRLVDSAGLIASAIRTMAGGGGDR